MAGYHHQRHICGCYFISGQERQYLPQVALDSHTLISPTHFTTQLKQTFSNPTTERVDQLRYTFPLYDGVAVSGYTITYADKILRGVVKQKDVARQTYQAAVDRGETAGLLESLPAGTFGVTLGNVPPGQDISVTISYCGELKHDAQIDGIRFNLPTSIAPRYGSYPGKVLQSNVGNSGGICITVDVDLFDSAIRTVRSPSHLLEVNMGGLSKVYTGGTAPFSSSQASVTLALGSVELDDDFVLQVLVDNIGNPKAVLETHATLPNQKAIMATLVPKFTLEQANPEIVFIADQSGSMRGSKNLALVDSLKVFLKSLPLAVRFNICAFGNDFQFLWPKSLPYSEDNLNTALEFVDTFAASLGGTELLEPIRQAFERHLKDMPLEIMLLTDGEIWGEFQVFDFINGKIRDEDVEARVFALGIGRDVSHTLVEGVARAGNGFAQFQIDNEEIDQKVMRMLKGAMFAHAKDYSLEVHYEDSDETSDESDFEIVLKDRLNISEQPAEKATKSTKSFFDESVDLDKHQQPADRYAHLPDVQTPAVLQAPDTIPPLFPFHRTTVYVLLGPDSPQKNITSITLRAKSPQGPLELSIPVHETERGTSIHQLAARKAIQDLEEGRGWLYSATTSDAVTENTVPIKEKHESRFDEIVEREAVRLGETFCVAGKFTSFVAVNDHAHELKDRIKSPDAYLSDVSAAEEEKEESDEDMGCGLFDSGPAEVPQAPQVGDTTLKKKMKRARHTASPQTTSVDRTAQMAQPDLIITGPPEAVTGNFNMTGGQHHRAAPTQPFGRTGGGGRRAARASIPYASHRAAPSPATTDTSQLAGAALREIISLQTFAGAWTWADKLLRLMGKQESDVNIAKLGDDKDIAATVLVVAYMETVLQSKRDVWELVVGKARAWLGKQFGGDEKKVEELILAAAEEF